MNIFNIKNRIINLRKINELLISFPKSGNTYVRFIIANLLAQYNNNENCINFSNIEKFVPTYLRNEIYKNELNIYPIIAKSHDISKIEFYLYKTFFRNDIIYILRNPLEVMKSYYLYRIKVDEANYKDISTFIRNKNFGIITWINNVEKYFPTASYIIIYEELLNNTQAELVRMIHFLNKKYKTNLDINCTAYVIEKTSRENMHKLEEQYKKDHPNGSFLIGGRVVRDYSFVNTKINRDIKISETDTLYIINEIKKMKSSYLINIILRNYFAHIIT